jgi:raffinose/stachyose/melibiose transport system substrate-binding protein
LFWRNVFIEEITMQTKILRIMTFVLLFALLVTALPACQSATPTAAPAEPTTAPAAPTTAPAQPTAAPVQPTEAPAQPTTAPTAAQPTIKGGPLEVGVLWEEGSPSFDLVKAIGDSMEKDYPGTKVTYTFNNTAARPAIEARMLAGDPIDIDEIFNGMDPNSYQWVDNGYLLDLTDAMTTPRADGTKWLDDFNPLFKPAMSYKDKYYAAPQEVYIWLLHYNKALFDKWGVQPPKTWDDMLTLCDTIKKNGDGVAPIAVTGQVNFYVGMWFDTLIQRIAGSEKVMDYLYGDNTSTIANDPDFLQATTEMMKLKTNNCLINGWEGTDFTTTQAYFFQGKAAMILMGSWLATEMKASIPEGFQLAVAPFPTYTGGKGKQDSIFGIASSESIPAKSKNPELAIEFLRRFTSKTESTKRVDQLGSVPAVNVPAPASIQGIDDVMQNAKTAEFILYNYGVNSAQYGLAAAWYDPVVLMWEGKLTPEQALAKIDSNVAAVRAQRAAAK